MSLLTSVWRLLDRRQRGRLVALQLVSLIMGLSTAAGIATVLPFITALSSPQAVGGNRVWSKVVQLLHLDIGVSAAGLGIAFGMMVLLANAINFFGFLALNRFAFQVGDTLYTRLFNEYMHRDYEFHTRSNSSYLASRVLRETTRVTAGILQQGLILVTNLLTILLIAASLVLVNPPVAVAAVLGLGAGYAGIYLVVRRRLLRNGQAESRYDAERQRTVNESLGAIREITLAQARELFMARFADQCRTISRAVSNTLAIAHSPRYILECFALWSLVAIAVYLRSSTASDGHWVAQLSFIAFAVYRMLPALQLSFSAVVKIRAERSAFASIAGELRRAPREVLQNDLRRGPREVLQTRAQTREPAWHGRPRREIHLSDVSFRYAPEQAPAISGVSLVIPAGTVVGLLGQNGSGKTTLLDLVSGLLAPQSGHIEVDGMRLDASDLPAWQSNIAYVPQQVFMFDATLAENIALGLPRAEIDLGRLETAVQLSRLTECVASLPRGYEERLGERGCRLSGGQRQRVAIARALYRKSSLLILDEATSSLDGAAEAEIIEMLQSLRQNRTVIIVTHRPAALHRCDLVFELRGGKLSGPSRDGERASLATMAKDSRLAPRTFRSME